jgi:uncharacterized membrane protein YhaH (DUF805 family)
VKRLHDIGWSGWAIVVLLIPIVGAMVIWMVTWFFAGKFGTNMYGPDPRFAHERILPRRPTEPA